MNPVLGPLGLWPPRASAYAAQVDHLVWAFSIVIALLVVPIFVALVYFMLKYRHGRNVDRDPGEARNVRLELTWTLVPFAITMIFFVWAASLYVDAMTPPPGALNIRALAQQWMWKFEHPGGQQEIDTLHVPMGEPVKVTMISQDVIHALYIPALRVQFDVLPGRYTTVWFNADRAGTYRLYCAQYCGTNHSAMDGFIEIMPPQQYQAWLERSGTDGSLAAQGKALFERYGCSGCHGANATVHAPPLAGVYGHVVPMSDGTTVIADERYIRDRIVLPHDRLVAGYPRIMPNFAGQIPESDLIKLIAYIESLGQSGGNP
jgi:cytochrome c oxidase subunit 2